MIETFSDDPKRKSLHLRDSHILAIAVGQNPRQLQDFGQPSTVVFALSLDLEGNQVPLTLGPIVRSLGAFAEIQLTDWR
jgi:hypothetical protein